MSTVIVLSAVTMSVHIGFVLILLSGLWPILGLVCYPVFSPVLSSTLFILPISCLVAQTYHTFVICFSAESCF